MLLARYRMFDRQGPGIGGRQERTTIVAQAAAPASLPPAQQADSQVGPGAGVRSQVAVAVDTSCRLTPATRQVPAMRCSSLSSFQIGVSTKELTVVGALRVRYSL